MVFEGTNSGYETIKKKSLKSFMVITFCAAFLFSCVEGKNEKQGSYDNDDEIGLVESPQIIPSISEMKQENLEVTIKNLYRTNDFVTPSDITVDNASGIFFIKDTVTSANISFYRDVLPDSDFLISLEYSEEINSVDGWYTKGLSPEDITPGKNVMVIGSSE